MYLYNVRTLKVKANAVVLLFSFVFQLVGETRCEHKVPG